MRRKFLFLVLVCSFGLFSSVSASILRAESQLTDEAMAQIVKSVLEKRLSNHKVYPLNRELILSTENMNVDFIPNPISSIQLSFLKPDEIRERDQGNIRYLVFGDFKHTDSGVVEIGLREVWRDRIA